MGQKILLQNYFLSYFFQLSPAGSDETEKVKKKGILKTLKEKKEKFEALNKEYDSLADILKKEKK